MDYPRVMITTEGVPDNIEIDSNKLVKVSGLSSDYSPFIETRILGNLKGQSFYLDSDYDWIVGTDNQNTVVLVPLRK